MAKKPWKWNGATPADWQAFLLTDLKDYLLSISSDELMEDLKNDDPER